MKHSVVQVKNIVRFGALYMGLVGRDRGVPGIGLAFGKPGTGKSTAIAHMLTMYDGVYMRANALWTPHAMIGQLAHELGGPRTGSSAKMLAYCVETLAKEAKPRAIFVDEADYVIGNKQMVEALRDVHDMTQAPLILIGMDGIERKIKDRPQFSRRISQWCEFVGVDFEDARKVIDTVCEVKVADDLAELLFNEVGGNIGNLTVGLARIEQHAKSKNLAALDADGWGKRRKFTLSAPPKS